MKDYYKIIGVPYDATAGDIRKAYHQLVVKYHPDKNPENKHANAIFLELQEAYHVLSNEQRRYRFHVKSHYPFANAKKRQELTSQSILTEVQSLTNHIASVGHYRLNPKLIQQHINQLLADENLQLLNRENIGYVKEEIISKLIKVVKHLPYERMKSFQVPLLAIANNNAKITNEILRVYQYKSKWKHWENYNTLIILFITVLICLLILFLAS